jgi:hypothetical protein
MTDNAGFTLTFLLVTSSTQAKMCPERLPEEHKTSVPLVRRGHLWRGVAEHATQRSGRARSR